MEIRNTCNTVSRYNYLSTYEPLGPAPVRCVIPSNESLGGERPPEGVTASVATAPGGSYRLRGNGPRADPANWFNTH